MSVDTFCEADAVMKKCVVQINMKTQWVVMGQNMNLLTGITVGP